MASLVPIAYAAADVDAFQKLLHPIVTTIIDPIIGLMFAVALVVFAYGVLQVVWKGEDASSKEAGRSSMLYGVIGMFIMISAWGIIYLISNSLKAL